MRGCLVLVVGFVLSLALIVGGTLLYNRHHYTPTVNSAPKYKMTVEGKIEPALQKDIQLKWIATYATTNPKCAKTINAFEGVSRSREQIDTILTQPDASGHYHYEIPLDKYLPGECGWRLWTIDYSVLNDHVVEHSDTFFFKSQETQKTKKQIERTLYCRGETEAYGCAFNYDVYQEFTETTPSHLSTNKNYRAELNIVRGDKK